MHADRNEGWEPKEPGGPQTKSIRTGAILFGEEKNKHQSGEYQPESGSRGSPGSRLISAAARAFHAATLLGIRLSVHGGFIEWEAERQPPKSLLDSIGDHKPELIQILRGDRCRWCGERLAWPRPVGVVEGTGTALHLQCYEPAEVARLLAAGPHQHRDYTREKRA